MGADVGVWSLERLCKNFTYALPNKVFEYLSADLPLISSLQGEIADLIEKNEIGFNYLPGDANGLYQCIEKLATDVSLRHRMSQSARKIFYTYGDADRTYDEYADYIEKLVENFVNIDRCFDTS